MTRAARSITIGFDHRSYAVDRNVVAPVPQVRFRRARRLPLDRMVPRLPAWVEFTYVPLAVGKVDLVHTWNRISIGHRPWGVSFESVLPRYFLPENHVLVRRGMRALASSRCRFIVAISHWAYRLFLRQCRQYEVDLREKLQVVYPHQPPVTRAKTFEPPGEDEAIRLMFVGSQFFRKGGSAIIEAMARVGDELNVRCTIVGRLERGEIGARDLTDAEFLSLERRLHENDRIRWHPYVEGERLQEMVLNSHVGMLPTFNDTFGYGVIEFMAAGVPVAASGISALPEILDGSVGWLWEVPTAPDGYWEGWNLSDQRKRRDCYLDTHARLVDCVVSVLREIRANPAMLAERSSRATARVEELFDPSRRGQQMREIYDRALDGF